MNKHLLRNDIQVVLRTRGITLHRLASESGVEAASLWRFVNNEKANLSTDSLFKLWPHLYGAQTPFPVLAQPPETPHMDPEEEAQRCAEDT